MTGDVTAVPNKEPDILQKMKKVAVKHYLGEILAMKEDKVFDMFHIHVTQAHYIWRFNMSINLAPNAQTFFLITKTISCLAKWKKTMVIISKQSTVELQIKQSICSVEAYDSPKHWQVIWTHNPIKLLRLPSLPMRNIPSFYTHC